MTGRSHVRDSEKAKREREREELEGKDLSGGVDGIQRGKFNQDRPAVKKIPAVVLFPLRQRFDLMEGGATTCHITLELEWQFYVMLNI